MAILPQERFWRKVDRRTDDECWLWTGSRYRNGYGHFSIGLRDGYAHRFSYQFAVGSIPDGMYICHHCDNPPCVNPAHLFLGTAADNAADRDAKGRGRHSRYPQPRAQRKPYVRKGYGKKLTGASAQAIRDGLANGLSRLVLAQQFNVTPTMIGLIARGEAWVPTKRSDAL